jgi:hypothetical protein
VAVSGKNEREGIEKKAKRREIKGRNGRERKEKESGKEGKK